jgi:ABC-type transport system involved in multi-copper enzyme maturation permease subunit
LLAKPVTRSQLLLGKFLGLTLTLAVNVTVMILGIFASIFYLRHSFQAADTYVLTAGILILVELMVVISIAVLFSTFSTPALSALFTFTLYAIGHFNTDIKQYGTASESFLTKVFAGLMYYLLPNFGNFDIISATAHGRFPSLEVYLYTLCYGLLYSTTVLLLSVFLFQHRNFK